MFAAMPAIPPGATAHGGTIIVDGNASGRCGISMKGVDIIVKGSIGPMSAFMAQAGTLAVFGDVGEAFGDSLYEAKLLRRAARSRASAPIASKKPMDGSAPRRALRQVRRAGARRRSRCRRVQALWLGAGRSIISMSTMRGLIDERAGQNPAHHAALFGDLRSPIHCRRSAAPRRPASMIFAAAAPSGICRISTICCFSAPRCRAIRSRAIARNAAPRSRSARASPKSRSSSKFRSPSPA